MTFKVGSYYTVIGDTGYSSLKPGAVIKIKHEELGSYETFPDLTYLKYKFHSFDWGGRNSTSDIRTLFPGDRPALKPATRKQIARYKKERSLRS